MSANSTPTTQQIPVEKIQPSPFQARKNFDPETLKIFAQSLKDHGLINPINVRPVADHYELVAGERRWRAAKLLGWPNIRAQVDPVDDQEAAQRILVENVQREDLSAMEQAQGYKRLSDPPFSLTQAQIAAKVGKSQALVNAYLDVAKLKPEVQQIISQLINLAVTHLVQIARLDSTQDQIAMAQEASKKELSVGQLKALVDQKLGNGGKKAVDASKTAPQEFRFSQKPGGVAINAYWDQGKGDADAFLPRLREALHLWCSQHPSQVNGGETQATPKHEGVALQ